MVVEVTAEDIADGKRTNCDQCPIALAASRAFGESCWASFRRIGLLGKGAAVDTPPVARAFMQRFDEAGAASVAPFTFAVELS